IIVDLSNMGVASPIQLIDFSRRLTSGIGDRGWDDGKMVADLLEWYVLTKNRAMRDFIETFIAKTEVLSGDKEYREALCQGIFAMTLIKLYPLGRPIKDRETAKAYLANSLRILR